MTESIQRPSDRTPAEVARLRELRERFQREKPTIADLEARGAEFAPLGEVVLLRALANELRQERERQAISPEQLAERLNITPTELASIESGYTGCLSLGVLTRVAHALGKQVTYSLVEKVA